MSVERVPVDPTLFTWPDEAPRLLGSECRDCGTIVFPAQTSCPACCSDQIVQRRLGTRGRLWTWTIQSFPPKPPFAGPATPEAFRPYGVGYVELPGETRVETPLTVGDPEQLCIGMEMELTFVPLNTDAEGREVMTFAFRPVASPCGEG